MIVNPTGSQTRPNSVTLSASLSEDATGTLQFKADGENIGDQVPVGQTVTFKASSPVNSYTFTVEYSGDDNYLPKTSDSVSYSRCQCRACIPLGSSIW